MSDNTGQGLLLGERIDAIESSLKLDRAIWQEYERRLDALEAMLAQQTHRRISKLEVETQRLGLTVDIKDDGRLLGLLALEAGQRERPTWDALRDVIPYMLDLVTLGYRSSAQTERIKSAVDDRIREQESAARGSPKPPVAKAPDEPPCPVCHDQSEPTSGNPQELGGSPDEPPWTGIIGRLNRIEGIVLDIERTQAKEQPCPKQDQSPSVAPSADTSGTVTARTGIPSSAHATAATPADHTAAVEAMSGDATRSAPSSAAELRAAVAAMPPDRSLIMPSIRLKAAASRAVEEIAALERHEWLTERGEIEARHRAEAERDEAVRLLREWRADLGNTISFGVVRKQQDVRIAKLDAFLARHPDAAQGGG